jgi:hypothetical protein
VLRVNPTSRGLYNLDLFDTINNEIQNNGFIIKELILKAIHEYKKEPQQILKFFSNN